MAPERKVASGNTDSAREPEVSGGTKTPSNMKTPSDAEDTYTSMEMQVLRRAASSERIKNAVEPAAERAASDAADNSASAIPWAVAWRLYLSHLLSTWNSRSFEFGSVLFLAAIYPNTLFYLSIYAMVRSASAILFATGIGWAIDRKARLPVVRVSIGMSPTSRSILHVKFGRNSPDLSCGPFGSHTVCPWLLGPLEPHLNYSSRRHGSSSAY